MRWGGGLTSFFSISHMVITEPSSCRLKPLFSRSNFGFDCVFSKSSEKDPVFGFIFTSDLIANGLFVTVSVMLAVVGLKSTRSKLCRSVVGLFS